MIFWIGMILGWGLWVWLAVNTLTLAIEEEEEREAIWRRPPGK